MSFCATNSFPNRTINQQDVNDFFALFIPLNQVINAFGLLGFTLSNSMRILSHLPFFPKLRNSVEVLTDIASRYLSDMNYSLVSHILEAKSLVPICC